MNGEFLDHWKETLHLRGADKDGKPTTYSLFDVMHVPQLHISLFSTQKLTNSRGVSEMVPKEPDEPREWWLWSGGGKCVARVDVTRAGRPTLDVQIVWPNGGADQNRGGGHASEAAPCHLDTDGVGPASPTLTPVVPVPVQELAAVPAAGSQPSVSGESTGLVALEVGLLHRRLGHTPVATIRRMASTGVVRGLEGGLRGEMGMCRGCMLGKSTAPTHPLRNSEFRANEKLALVHIDAAGPLTPESWDREKYWVVLIDDFSRKSWVFFVRQKSEIPERLK